MYMYITLSAKILGLKVFEEKLFSTFSTVKKSAR
jgi:hypothetical protein